MEPIRISLRNFSSYRDETVDLSGITLAALVGENGAGKSSLLDALTWTLFGEGTKGGKKELDNYVTRGEKEGQVEVQFRLNGSTYRVVRGRNIARNKSTLEFFIRDGDSWRPLSGKTLAETQAAIEATLRMDYRTFTASALVLQGQADAFTANMTDQERKEALARILGLDLWDRMQERAKEKARQLKAEVQALEQAKQRLQAESGRKDEIEAGLAVVKAQLRSKADQVEAMAAEVADLEAQVRQKPALEQALEDARKAMRRAIDAKRDNEDAQARTKQKIAQAEQGIKAAEAILARREEIEAATEMEAEIARDVAEFDRQAQEYMRLSSVAAELERKAAAWDKTHESEIAGIRARIEALRTQAGTMDKVPCGPTDKAACPLLAGAKKAAAEIEQLEHKLSQLKQQTNPHAKALQEAVRARDELAYDQDAHQAARLALEDVRKTSRLKPEVDAAVVRSEELRARIAELTADLNKLEAEVERIEAEQREAVVRYEAAKQALDALTPAAQKLAAKQGELARLRQEEAALRTELGRLEQSLEQATKAAAELEALAERERALREEMTVYEVLEQACGKKAGVPALIMENAVPEIERLANAMLARMAGGRLQVRLDTQAEGKTTGTMQEVLRITVLDGGIERPYQTYSGAERFMVDLALRVALSKFLTHRAGAEIKLFVLDEGLGACDQANRQAVMQAIQTVAQEFGKVLVITHIAELQDALPQRIEVTKGPDGSKVKVA